MIGDFCVSILMDDLVVQRMHALSGSAVEINYCFISVTKVSKELHFK